MLHHHTVSLPLGTGAKDQAVGDISKSYGIVRQQGPAAQRSGGHSAHAISQAVTKDSPECSCQPSW